MECYHYLLAIEDIEWSLSLLNFLTLLFQIHFFGLVLCMTKKPILWRHHLWRHKNLHCISAKYHCYRLHTFEGETFGSFDFLITHKRVLWLVTKETQYWRARHQPLPVYVRLLKTSLLEFPMRTVKSLNGVKQDWKDTQQYAQHNTKRTSYGFLNTKAWTPQNLSLDLLDGTHPVEFAEKNEWCSKSEKIYR